MRCCWLCVCLKRTGIEETAQLKVQQHKIGFKTFLTQVFYLQSKAPGAVATSDAPLHQTLVWEGDGNNSILRQKDLTAQLYEPEEEKKMPYSPHTFVSTPLSLPSLPQSTFKCDK